MRPMLVKEFEELYREYINATTTEDRKIKLKLDAIANCYKECGAQERAFADEITAEFCRLITLLREQNKKKLSGENEGRHNTHSYMACSGFQQEVQIPFKDSAELLDAFYHHFKDKMVEATLKDYVARINTFAYSEKYLSEMVERGDLGREVRVEDPIMFTYINIELIVARFNTKDESGKSVKQRLNIRSALRKLNEFKLEMQSAR